MSASATQGGHKNYHMTLNEAAYILAVRNATLTAVEISLTVIQIIRRTRGTKIDKMKRRKTHAVSSQSLGVTTAIVHQLPT